MEIKILQVFYGKDGLPYKDKDRQVHFPIAGTGFLGASNTTKIKFYYDELDDLDETTWVAVSKLPNGRIGSRVLESYLDDELNEHYALLELDNYYTQYKGDVFISLQGYQGGVDLDYDEENSQYEIHGTPTIAATGSIKFTINYANQFVGSGETDNINFQRILAALGTKLGMREYSEHVEELPSEGSPDVFYVVNDDPNNPNLANIYVWNENTRHYIWVGDNTLDLGEYYTKEQGENFEENIENRVNNVETMAQSLANGGARGVYATLSALQSDNPSHDYIYVVLADGHWYYWNGSAWTDGGAFISAPFDNDFDDTSVNAVQNRLLAKLVEEDFDEKYDVDEEIETSKGYFVHKDTGQLVEHATGYYTDFIDTTDIEYIFVSGKARWSTCMVATYDANQTFLRSYGKGTDAGITWHKEKFEPKEDEKYARFGSLDIPLILQTRRYVAKVKETNENVETILGDYYVDRKVSSGIEILTGKYIDKTTGNAINDRNSFYTDFVDTSTIKSLYITAYSNWNICIVAAYDSNHNFIRAYGYNNDPDTPITYNEQEFVPQDDEKYLRFSSVYTRLEIQKEIKAPFVAEEIDTHQQDYIDITSSFEISVGYWNRSNGRFEAYSNCAATNKIKVEQGDLFKVSGNAQYNVALIVAFDSNGSYLRAYGVNGGAQVISEDFEYTPANDEVYVAFSSLQTNIYPLVVKKYGKVTIMELINRIEKNTYNVLAGKKYVACGDSFTAALGEKTYPSLIAKRNGMKLHNMAYSGSYAHYSTDAGRSFVYSGNSFYYQNIDEDADYITIAYGLNESGATIGDVSSSDNTTIWGAYNEILGWLVVNRPNAKIGIISSDAWQTYAMRNALKEIAARWGVSFLDLKEYGKPLMIGGKFVEDGAAMKTAAVNARNSQYQVSAQDSHPNETAHKVRSTIIEEWMRGM